MGPLGRWESRRVVKRGLNSYTSQAARAAGYRSGFEEKLANELDAIGVKYTFEDSVIVYYKPIKNGICSECSGTDIEQVCEYHPDFYLPEFNVYIETKGRFVSSDRRKHELIKKQYPDVDLRILFEYDGKATPNRRYSEWCEWKGIQYGIAPQKVTKKRHGIYLPEDWRLEFTK